jgi:hypothetical protein
MDDLEKHPGMVGWWATGIPDQNENLVYYDTALHTLKQIAPTQPVHGTCRQASGKQPFIRFLVALVKKHHSKRTFVVRTDTLLEMLSAFSEHNGLEIANTVTSTVAMGMAFGAFKAAARRRRVGSADRRTRGFVIYIAELKEELILTNQYGDYNDVLP